MNAPQRPAAPKSGDIPTFDELANDPEIAALLDFEPVPHKMKRANMWTPALQQRFIAYLAHTGSPAKAAGVLQKDRYGAEKLCKREGGEEFAAAWDSAIDLFFDRQAQRSGDQPAQSGGARPCAGIDRRVSGPPPRGAPVDINGNPQQPGQVMNEHGEWEDEESFHRRGEEAMDNIRAKLLRARRLYLAEICYSPGKRAAFEILTELPVDWEKAEALQPQPFEPWARTNQRQSDMILTAESGWSFGEIGYGPDKMAEARRVLNESRIERGLEPISWDEEGDDEASTVAE